MKKNIVVFDLDGTLFLPESYIGLKRYQSARKYTQAVQFGPWAFWMIQLNMYRKLFQKLTLQGYHIGFMTLGGYDKDVITNLLEKVYQLPGGCLKSSLFFNKYDFLDTDFTKVIKLQKLIEDKKIDPAGLILLVDDDPKQIAYTYMQNTQIVGVQAMGALPSQEPNFRYLESIHSIIDSVKNSKSDKTANKKTISCSQFTFFEKKENPEIAMSHSAREEYTFNFTRACC